jgi:hypothetical protein
VRIALPFLLCLVLHGFAPGQEVVERIEQLQAESEVMNSPSCVLFDATRIVSSEKKDNTVQTKCVGRRVVGPNGEVRVDVRIGVLDFNRGSEHVHFEHFIRYGPNDFRKATRFFGSELTVYNLEKSLKEGTEPAIPFGFYNPFLVVTGGDFAFMGIVRDFDAKAPLAGIENAVRSARNPKAGVLQTYRFHEKTPWAVLSMKSMINPRENDAPNWKDVRNPKEYVKNWNVLGSCSTDWIEVKDVGVLPARVVSQIGLKGEDRKRDFEVYYFGYDFDTKPLELLFDRKRFNDADILRDFPIESILEQSSAAQEDLKNQSSKKAKRR